MPDRVVASRYAEALLEAVADPGELELVHENLSAVAGVVADNLQLKAFLEGPNIIDSHKEELVGKVFGERVDPMTRDFLRLLLDKHRIDHLGLISEEFQRLVERKRGQIRVKITTAIALPPDILDRLKRALDVSLGLDCILEPRVDKRVIGGVVAVVGDRVIDGSIRTAFDEMRKELMGAPLRS